MESAKFKLKCKKYLWMIFASLLHLGICQDRIIVSNHNFDEDANNSTTEDSMIPESLLIELGGVQNVSDLLRRFVTTGMETPMLSPAVITATVDNATERRVLAAASTGTIAIPANCQTEQHIVELEKPANGATIFWPSCVRVRRCSGCCMTAIFLCKPIATSILNVTVLQLFYNHEYPNSFVSQGTKIFSLEQHDRCACSCKQVADDCDPDVHEYRTRDCKCVCKNAEQAALCTGPKKIWDSRYCKCKCRIVRTCSSGRHFNEHSCRCEIRIQSLASHPLSHQNTTTALSLHNATPSS